MSDLPVLITGAGGMLGRRLAEKMQSVQEDVFLHYHRKPEIPAAKNYVVGELDDEAINETIRKFGSPRLIINAAGITDVDLCQRDPDLSERINARAPIRLAQAFPDAKFVQISTDYVFPSRKKPPLPRDPVGPINKYGQDKLAAEDHLLALSDDNLIVRISLNYDFVLKRGFFRHVYDTIQKGNTIHGITDQVSNPCWSFSYAEMIMSLLERNASGIWHLGGKDFVSRYEFATIIADIFGLDKSKIEKSSLDDVKRDAPRPHHSGLDCSESESILDRSLPTQEENLKEIKSLLQT
jgi:dTDP-4-dehydrorhamnose reductase